MIEMRWNKYEVSLLLLLLLLLPPVHSPVHSNHLTLRDDTIYLTSSCLSSRATIPATPTHPSTFGEACSPADPRSSRELLAE